MKYMKSVTYVGSKAGKYADDKSKESLRLMKQNTDCNTVVIYIGALQDSPHSEYVDYQHQYIPSDEELIEVIEFVKSIGLMVVLKPVVNCKDGTWRAYISFFDEDVICAPKWSNWFKSYTEFQIHYAKIAEQTACDMMVLGSDMVMSEKRETEWRDLIQQVRENYSGLLTYSTDKYQEDNVKWWDALDVISTCAYYPINTFAEQMDRIETIVHKYNKPFIISEIGCKSTVGSSLLPNQWELQGKLSLQEQVDYFTKVFEVCRNRKFIQGISIWNWNYLITGRNNSLEDKGYSIAQKPVCDVIYEEWKED